MKPIVKRMWTCERLRSYNDLKHAVIVHHVCPEYQLMNYCKGDRKCKPITITIREGHGEEG